MRRQMSSEPTREPDRPKADPMGSNTTPHAVSAEYAQRTGESGVPVAREAPPTVAQSEPGEAY